MGIRPDPNNKGCFEVRYDKRHPITRKPCGLRRRQIKTMVEAKRVYNELVLEVAEKIKRQIVPSWSQFLTKYFQHIETLDITNNTRYNREKSLRFHTEAIWRDKLVDEITREDILNLLSASLKTYTESSRKCFVKYLRGVFEYALECDLIQRNPTPKLKFKISKKINAVLNLDQIEALLRFAQEQKWDWYPHYAVAVFTGMRNGELYALKWESVDLAARQILVNCSWGKHDGLKSTKSGHDRLVEIPKPLIPLLRELKLKAGDSDFVLPRLTRWDRGEQAHDLRMFLTANGLPVINFHSLRASWATMLLNKGVEPAKVMSMGGWSDLKTLMIYVRKAGIDIKGSTSALDDIDTHGLKQAEVVQIRQPL